MAVELADGYGIVRAELKADTDPPHAVILGKIRESRPGVSMFVAVEFAQEEAARAAQGLAADGYKADFTIAGLAEVDRFFHDHAPGGVPTPGGRLAEFVGERLFAIAGYIGETLRRELGGTWRHRPGAEANPTAVEVMLPDGRVLEPYEWCFSGCRHSRREASTGWVGCCLTTEFWPRPTGGRGWPRPRQSSACGQPSPGCGRTMRRRFTRAIR